MANPFPLRLTLYMSNSCCIELTYIFSVAYWSYSNPFLAKSPRVWDVVYVCVYMAARFWCAISCVHSLGIQMTLAPDE